jgi:REP element-mobilizing transposase RayT
MGRVIGFHVIGCTYGFWLPNDQRGSGSDCVRNPVLRPFGPATKINHRRSVASAPFDPQIRRLAREALDYPVVELDGRQVAAIGRGVTREIEQFRAASVHAFAQLPNHFHFVCGPCRYDIRRFEGRLKGAATRQLLEEGIHPLQTFRDREGRIPSPWSVKPWVVYLFTSEDIVRSIDYVNRNLVRARMKPQQYSFIVPYRGDRALD